MQIFNKKIFSKNIRSLTIWAITGFLISFVMMNSRSYLLWKLLPFHDFIQFPWRLLIFTTFFTAVLAAILTEVVRNKILVGSLIIFLSLLLTFNYFKPSQLVYKGDNDYKKYNYKQYKKRNNKNI